jgi:acyl transferase domain-containing protein/NAD(P)-dependent dehydrogenase (short-subunit alcohol dehydrogenase family)/acyl carrier protein
MTNPSRPLTGLSAIKLALMAKQARAQLGPLTQADPIAIIGMGCRFPGGAHSPEAYWSLLKDGVDAVREMPRNRWDVDAFYDADPATPGKTSAKTGGFLDRVDLFDAAFFGILRREAERMDPQHRLFLEVAVEALDRAGLSRERLAGSSTGVFIASYYNDYTFLQFADHDWIDARTLTGTQHSVLANRLSYLLDLRGPSISIDTACSSSLVATHLACQSLRMGESDVALAGGVSLMLAPEMMITLSKVGFMSPGGRCRTFDALADGFTRGEGCGVVVLKRLSDAIADNDRVLAIIRGSAVNQDGRSTVLAAPNGLAQQALVREALGNAQLTADRVGFVETHGTATPLGDPIEVEALAATIGAPRSDASLCYLGSAKANLGHLEAAAGVAGLIKAALVLMHAEIPRQVHFSTLNPHVSLKGTCLAVADRHLSWHAGALPRVAGVSGFGVGGTNAHVLLEEAPALAESAEDEVPLDEPRMLALSAQSPTALHTVAADWLAFLDTTREPIGALTHTAGARRSHYDQRLAVVGRTKEELAAKIRAFTGETSTPAVAAGSRPSGGDPRIAFVFSGQGPQWARMGAELAAREPVFRDTLADLDARFQRLAGWSLAAALDEPAESSRLHETEIAQPAIFAIQVALAALWNSWGIRPDTVVGHSIGELAALHVAGVLSLEDAVSVVWHRGRIMQRATGLGKMAAAGLTVSEAQSLVREIGSELSLAAINAPRSMVLSGSTNALELALLTLDSRGISHRTLPVSYAFHSAQMEPFEAELVAAIGTIVPRPGHAAVYSTVTGAAIDHAEIDAAYFGRNVRQTVRFATAIDAMLDGGVDAFVEVAPHPVLAASIDECLAARGQRAPVVACLRRGRPELETMLQACAGIYAAGRSPNWEAVTPSIAPPVDLPPYPWQRERFWLRDAAPARQPRSAPDAYSERGLLGVRRSNPGSDRVIYEGRWPAADLTWLADHEVAGRIVVPGAALLDVLHAAAQDASGSRAFSLADFVVLRPLVLGDAATWTTVVTSGGEEGRVEIWTSASTNGAEGSPQLVASARIAERCAPTPLEISGTSTGEWQDGADALYGEFGDLGVRFGPEFRTLERWRVRDGNGEAWLGRAAEGSHGGREVSAVHPALLDGALQLCVLAAGAGQPRALLLPVAVEAYTLHRTAPPRLRAEVTISDRGTGGTIAAAIRLLAEDDSLVASLDGVRFAPADAARLADVGPYDVRWHALTAPAPGLKRGDAHGAWLVLTNGHETGAAIVSALAAAGGRCLEVRSSDAAIRASLSEPAWRDGQALRGIIHTWSLDADSAPDTDAADWLTTGSALSLVQEIDSASLSGVPIWFVTSGAQPVLGAVSNARQAGLWGLANVVAAEYPDLSCRAIDLDPYPTSDDVDDLVGELTRAEVAATRMALRGGVRYVPRLERRSAVNREPSRRVPTRSRLAIATAGTIDGLTWQQSQVGSPRPGEVRLRVLAAGVNFRDVLLAVGMYPAEGTPLGAECVGIVEALGDGVATLGIGDTVFGFAPGSHATEVNVPASFLVGLPAGLTVEQAAALPVAFLTAMYGLQEIAGITPGSRVLIHAGAGGVGLAAIQIAQRRGARVFATAGSPVKRARLQSLGVERVFDSRSVTFADEVLAATDGAGVDVVLNSLAGEFIPASLRALGAGGWFLELGKRGIWTPEQMQAARRDVRYRAYDLGLEAQADPSLVSRLLGELCTSLDTRELSPLPVRTFAFSDGAEAFRFMAQARHIGKLVLRSPHAATEESALVRADATYWITGGAGALGARTARWLVESGARHIVLTGRRSAVSEDAQRIIDECTARGAEVRFRVADAADETSMIAVRDEILEALPPLRGVVHAAGAVDDGILVQQTWPRCRAVLDGKARGARVLDAITRDLPLDFFVLYSSAGVLLGPIGQGAYAAANAELDAIAWARRSSGLPALSVAWGQWKDAGMAARMVSEGIDPWSARGLGWLEEKQALTQLELLLKDGATYAAVLPIDWQLFLSRLPGGVDPNFFAAVAPAKRAVAPPPAGKLSTEVRLVDHLRAAPSTERHTLLLAHVAERTRHVIGLDENVALDARVALKDVGLDSLMAVELRNVLTRSLGTSLPATLLFDYPSLDALVSYLGRLLQLVPDTPYVGGDKVDRASLDALTSLTDDEAEALLLAELDGTAGMGG